MSNETHTANQELAALVEEARDREIAAGVDQAALAPMITMRLGHRWFAAGAEAVRGIVTCEAVTRVPALPSHVLGVTSVQGRLVAVIDLFQLMGISVPGEPPAGKRRLVIFQGDDTEISVIADEAKGVIELPAPDRSQASGQPFVVGEVSWNDELVCVLDAEELIAAACGKEAA